MNLKNVFSFLFITKLFCILTTFADKISYYIMTEHATMTYINPKYLAFANFSSSRHGRQNPLYYVEIHAKILVPFDDSFQVDFYFYQFLSNEYRRSFVEMHFKWCTMLHNDMFFGSAMNQGNLTQPCPHPPGAYHMYNMSIPSAAIPPGFPFTKGRIYANLTHGTDLVASGYIDMELKENRRRKQPKSLKNIN